MAKKQWTEAEKKAQAEKAAAARNFLKTDDVLAVAENFKPRIQELNSHLVLLVSEVGYIVAEIAGALGFIGSETLPTGDTKKQIMSIFTLCGADSQVKRYAGEWASVILGREHDANIGAEKGDDYEGEGIKSWKELRAAAAKGNEKLGIKARGKRGNGKSAEVKQLQGTEIYSALAEVLKTQAGVNSVRRVLNAAGFEMVILKTAEMAPITPEVDGKTIGAPATADRSESVNVQRTLRLDAELKAKAHADHVAKMKARKARKQAKARKVA